ncbi:MAG: hypothetical protein HYT34_00530 [Candidatus Ryanbacteria bacterium]|nr:hypothetical protein [Candidatus Ryanbacteria bacterium]
MRQKNIEREQSEIQTSLVVFLETYNQGVPEGYPHASVKALKEFQAVHPLLFKRGDFWSIDKHRKKLMDWLFSHSSDA